MTMGAVCLLSALCVLCADASAKSPDAYAASSVLASGKWVKIKVSSTGMQYLSAARLRQLGFNDPAKVNVYGYGGRLISDLLDDRQTDDLPMQPVVRTATGLLFYGVDNLRYSESTSGEGNITHISDPYSDDSFYFLSDREITPAEMPVRDASSTASGGVNSFRATLVHERDLSPAGDTGRLMLGEDFRSNTTQSFPFTLTDRTGGSASVIVSFATKTTGGASTLGVAANGKSIGVATIPACSGEGFISRSVTTTNFTPDADNVAVQLSYRSGGTLFTAGLDYIEVHYDRALRLRDGQLPFRFNLLSSTTANIEGCSQQTQIWDVTDPAFPVRLSFTLDGSTARIKVPSGYSEYIAFNPEVTALQPTGAGNMTNQDIHALATPDMLIISPREYSAAAEKIADMHRRNDDMRVHVITPEELYNEFSSGVKDLSAFRKAMKMWYDRGKDAEGHYLRYCLLMGRPAVNCKAATASSDGGPYAVMPIWQSEEGSSETSSYSTDCYIGMLEDSKGSFTMSRQKVSVAVGRFPVKNVTEANAAAEKLLNYVENPSYGNWRNRVLIIADDNDSNAHIDDAEDSYAFFNRYDGEGYKYERLYLDSYPLEFTGNGPVYTQARERYYSLLDEGVMYINYLGHGNPTSWGHEKLMTWTDLTSLKNRNLPFITAGTCDFARWDDSTVCGAENMWLNTSGGVIGFISASRKVWISQNGFFMEALARNTFTPASDGRSKRVGDFFVDGLNALSNDDNKLRYLIMGDPAMRLPFHECRVLVEEIDGKPVGDGNKPEVKARGRFTVKGSVLAPDGSPLPDFNGFVEMTLMDAEVVIETFGNGDQGKTKLYNDRKTKLFSGKAAVEGGVFTMTVNMPSEIDNNYSPALMSLYACSDSGVEANGAFTDFYVYGYDHGADNDNEGPAIERFTLNNDGFADGDVTHDTPVVLATLSDPSGINLSDGGIGHKLTLTLDDKTVYDNLNSSFSPSLTDASRGELAYIMPALEPGRHTLRLTAWDNANNCSTASISFQVAVNRGPTLYDITTDGDGTSSVTFVISHDMPRKSLSTAVEVFDLNGLKVWSGLSAATSDIGSDIRIPWDLTDSAGRRVARGIYVYRVTVTTPDGSSVTKSKKLAVSAHN